MTAIDFTELSVTELVSAATHGDQEAWASIVVRYQPLVRSVARRFRLSASDVDDVSQTVWLKLVECLDELREPRALPGWLAVTTARASLAVSKALTRTIAVDPLAPAESGYGMQWLLGAAPESDQLDHALLRQETRQAVREGLADLPQAQRDLLLLLVAEPPLSYEQISERVGLAVGSIGPTRRRCLSKLRETDAVRQAGWEFHSPSRAA
jgi:RNA polymerase sigma factor (sigma-70 family)